MVRRMVGRVWTRLMVTMMTLTRARSRSMLEHTVTTTDITMLRLHMAAEDVRRDYCQLL